MASHGLSKEREVLRKKSSVLSGIKVGLKTICDQKDTNILTPEFNLRMCSSVAYGSIDFVGNIIFIIGCLNYDSFDLSDSYDWVNTELSSN